MIRINDSQNFTMMGSCTLKTGLKLRYLGI